VLAATALRLRSTWSGRSPRAPIEETYWLTKGTRGWAGEAAFSVAQARKRRVPLRPKAHSVDAFLGDLGASPLLDYPYSPSLRHTDSYPHLQFEVLAGERSVRFESESQAHGNVPWAITLEGHTYTVPTGAPADALDRLRSGLGLNVRQIFDELGRDLESER
jgi:hypothetical protein